MDRISSSVKKATLFLRDFPFLCSFCIYGDEITHIVEGLLGCCIVPVPQFRHGALRRCLSNFIGVVFGWEHP